MTMAEIYFSTERIEKIICMYAKGSSKKNVRGYSRGEGVENMPVCTRNVWMGRGPYGFHCLIMSADWRDMPTGLAAVCVVVVDVTFSCVVLLGYVLCLGYKTVHYCVIGLSIYSFVYNFIAFVLFR